MVDYDVGDGITQDAVSEEGQAFGSDAAQVRERGVVIGVFSGAFIFGFVGRLSLVGVGVDIEKGFGEGGRHPIGT